MERIIEHFRQTHDVITPGLIGFGRSGKSEHPYTPDLYARYLKQCIDELGFAPVTLVFSGYSPLDN